MSEFQREKKDKTWVIWHTFQIHHGLRMIYGRRKKPDSIVIQILALLLPALFPFESLFKNTHEWRFKQYERVRMGAARKAGAMKYFTLSPGFPLVWSLLDRDVAQVQLPWEYLHGNVAHTPQSREETKFWIKGRRNTIWDVFECFYSYIIQFCIAPSMAANRETGATIRVWCDTLQGPLFPTTPANMQAHLSRALKPSLILSRPKRSIFSKRPVHSEPWTASGVAQIPKSIIWKQTKAPSVRYFLWKPKRGRKKSSE